MGRAARYLARQRPQKSPSNPNWVNSYRAMVYRFVAHSRQVLEIASRHGWLPAARYTNLRDIRKFDRIGFIDVDWKRYSFSRHLDAVRLTKPLMTVAKDIEHPRDWERTLEQALELQMHCQYIVIVPKHPGVMEKLNATIPRKFLLGYSVPSKYGKTSISPSEFRHSVHLLGGRPEVQRRLASFMNVVSVDCNRFTLDAAYGDYFDGESFRPHPRGGYKRCLRDSIKNINKLWEGYCSRSSYDAS